MISLEYRFFFKKRRNNILNIPNTGIEQPTFHLGIDCLNHYNIVFFCFFFEVGM